MALMSDEANHFGNHELVPPEDAVIHPTRKVSRMNMALVAGEWQHLRGRIKERWGRLSDDELDIAEGRREQMIGLLRVRYGFGKERAQFEYDQFLRAQHPHYAVVRVQKYNIR